MPDTEPDKQQDGKVEPQTEQAGQPGGTPQETEAERLERRGRERHRIEVLGVVLLASREGRAAARAVNVSLGGILLESEAGLPGVGQEVELSFSIEELGLIFSIPGRVVRRPEQNQAAIQFHQESDKLRRVIEKALGVPR